MVNARWIKNKDHMLMEYLQEINCKLCIILETRQYEKDKICTESSKLRKNGCDMISYSKEDRKGGGIALVFKETTNSSKRWEKNSRTCQYAIWSVMVDKLHLNILGLYHPPNSNF